MASVNFLKLKGADVARIIGHCDKEKRENSTHKNKHIDTNETRQNLQIKNRDYSATIQRYKDRIRGLDQTTNTNKRSDRVSCFALETTVPEGMEPREFAQLFLDILKRKYGNENIIQLYLHFDEIHDYLDHGEVRTSRPHIHALVVPEIEGKLNGKQFSSRSAMRELNQIIDKECQERGFRFLTGEKARKRSVEALKEDSERELAHYKEIEGKYERLRDYVGGYKIQGEPMIEIFDREERRRIQNLNRPLEFDPER